MSLLKDTLNLPDTILATNETQGNCNSQSSYMAQNETDFPDGFPIGLSVVGATVGSSTEYLLPYIDTRVTVVEGTTTYDEQVVTGVTLSNVSDAELDRTVSRIASDGTPGATAILASKVVSLDLSAKTKITFLIKPDQDVAAGALQFATDDTADLASPVATATVLLPALVANEWNFVELDISSGSAATISVGFIQVTDLAAITFDVDRVNTWKQSTDPVIGFLQEEVLFDATLEREDGLEASADKRVTMYTQGEFKRDKLVGLDAAGITDLAGRLISNGTVLVVN